MTTVLSDLFGNRDEPLRLILQTALEGIWVIDDSGRTVYVNAQMAGMLGYAEADVIGRVPLDFMPDELRSEGLARFKQWRDGQLEHHDFCWRRRDGSLLWTLLSASPIHDRDRRFIGAFGMLVDITDRRQQEEALRASQGRLQLVLEATSEGVWDWSVATGEVFFSQQWLENLGYAPGDIEPHMRAWQRLAHPDDLPRMIAALDDHLEGRTATFVCENRVRNKDGAYRWHLNRGKVVMRDDSGRPVRMVGVGVDITVRKQVERALRERDDLLSGIVETSLDAIITIDEQQRIVQFNPAAGAIFGCAPDDAVGQPLSRYIPGRFHEAHARHIVEFSRSGGASRSMGGPRELWGLRCNGDEFPVEGSTISQIDIGGVRHYTVFLRDITARRAHEARLARSHEQLRELSSRLVTMQEEERTRISREIHDELGQMLTGIKMDLRWIERRQSGPNGIEEREACLAKLRGAIALVDDTVRTVQKIAAELRPAILDNLGIATAIGYETARFEERTDIRCRVERATDVADVPPEVATGLFRIFQEILTNVARHAAATHVTVRLSAGPDAIELVVADDGRGMSTGQIEQASSLGVLGMRERARLLDGEVHFAGAPGAGTTVTVRVPRRRLAAGGA